MMAGESESGSGAGTEMTPPMPAEGGQEDKNETPVTVPAASLPQGIEAKEGTELTFCLHGPPDDQGMVTGYFKGAESTGEGNSSWEDDFRKEMSPRAGETGDAA